MDVFSTFQYMYAYIEWMCYILSIEFHFPHVHIILKIYSSILL